MSHITASSFVASSPSAFSTVPGCGPCGRPDGCSVMRADVDALARGVVAVDVVHDLLGLHVGVVVGQRRSPASSQSSIRGQNEQITKFGPWNVWCAGGGWCSRPALGSKSRDVERVRVDVAVPADDVERVVVEDVVLVAAAHAHLELVLAALAVRAQLGRRVEVALGERRVLEQLAVAVAVAVRRLDLARRVEGQPALLAVSKRKRYVVPRGITT